MSTNHYIFDKNPQNQERRRLQLIEAALDHQSIDRLKRTGIQAGWRCLELGAGAGSIMNWMGSVVTRSGTVVAVDKNTNHIQEPEDPPIRIVEDDFLNVSFDEKLDLAHCRYVLIHNREGDTILRALGNLLKPGGYLVVEEPDFTSAQRLNAGSSTAQQRVNNAICRMFRQLHLDPGYGLSLPEKVAQQGLEILHVESSLHLDRGGSPMGQMMAESTDALREKYIATGEADAADIDEYIANSTNDEFWTVFYATISVIARK